MRLAGGAKRKSLMALVVGLATVAWGMVWATPGNSGTPCSSTPTVGLNVTRAALSTLCPAPLPSTTLPPVAAGKPTPSAPAPVPAPSSPAGTTLGPRPTPNSTGVAAGLVLKAWDRPLTFTVNNVTLDGIDFHGYPRISGSNITITN
jgi:hypothetical protein